MWWWQIIPPLVERTPPFYPLKRREISIIQMNTCNFEGRHTFVSVTVVGVTFSLVKALYITYYLVALFPGFMQCVDIIIFLGLSAWRMILIRLTYKKIACAEKTVMWARLCVTGVNQASSVNVLYRSYFICDRIRLNKLSTDFFSLSLSQPNKRYAPTPDQRLSQNKRHFFLNLNWKRMMFSVDYWNVPFSYRDFPFAHTVKEKHPQLFIIPLIVIPEINHLYLETASQWTPDHLYNLLRTSSTAGTSTARACFYAIFSPRVSDNNKV